MTDIIAMGHVISVKMDSYMTAMYPSMTAVAHLFLISSVSDYLSLTCVGSGCYSLTCAGRGSYCLFCAGSDYSSQPMLVQSVAV